MITVDGDYCPLCGTELGRTTVEGRDRRFCDACEEVVWRNPAPTAGVAVRDGDRVLMAERAPPREGWWTVPGGFLEHDEPAPVGAARELAEETNVSVDPADLRLLATHHKHRSEGVSTLVIRYVVDREATTGEPVAGSDVIDAEFRTLASLDDVNVHPANRRFVRLALERDEPYR